MKIDKLNTWIGFSGNIAILLGLIALAVEISENTAAVRAQELGAQRQENQDRQLAMLGADTREFYVKSLYNPAELTLVELQGMTAYLSYRVGSLERAYQSYLDGIIRPADWERRLYDIPIYLGTSFGRLWWNLGKNDYTNRPEFVSAVDQAIEAGPVVPDDQFLLQLQARAQALQL